MTNEIEMRQPLAPAYPPTIPNMLNHLVECYGDQDAQIRGASRISFREIEAKSAKLACGLLALGLGKGARVAIMMPDGPDFSIAFMAVTRIGGVAAPLSTLYKARELGWVLNHADIQVLLTVNKYLRHDYLDRLEEALPSLSRQSSGRLVLPEAPYLRTILVWGDCDRPWGVEGPAELERAARARPEIDRTFLTALEANVAPSDALCMIHTSGSTAQPKGVVHGHGPLIRHSYQMSHDFWPLGAGDRIVSIRPGFWVAGLSATLFHSLHKGCCLIVPEDDSATTIKALIHQQGANAVSGAPTWFRDLRNDPELAEYDIFRLSTDCAAVAVRVGEGARFLNPIRAAATPNPVHSPDALIPNAFGMTETCGAHSSPLPSERVEREARARNGRPVPGVSIKIVDPRTREPVPQGQNGELLVRGYCLMQGLYKRERNETFTDDGFYPTGDLCFLDDQGHLGFVSRLGEMIKVHGANVAPMEVEVVLNSLADIQKSAVVGISDGDGAVLLVAAVQMRDVATFDEAAVRQHLQRQLSSFKVPKRLFALTEEEMPVTGAGKIQKAVLTKMLRAKLDADDTLMVGRKPR